MTFRLPSIRDRVSVLGSTGSGKSTFAAYLLSHAPFHRQPYIMFDWKNEELINSIPNVREIGLHEKLPKEPGLYIVHCQYKNDDVTLEQYIWKVLRHERIGLYFDEAYMLPKNSEALAGILTQGRSKHIPAICCTQRPAWIQRFVFSEANFFACFRLQHPDDEKTVQKFIRMKDKDDDVANVSVRLPDFYSRWYDVGRNVTTKLSPVPKAEQLIEVIGARLPKRRRFL